MRSDILGFNAPICQKNGKYYYEDRAYSIFNLELQSEVNHPGMEELIKIIRLALKAQSESLYLSSELQHLIKASIDADKYDKINLKEPAEPHFQQPLFGEGFKWSWILNLISDH